MIGSKQSLLLAFQLLSIGIATTTRLPQCSAGPSLTGVQSSCHSSTRNDGQVIEEVTYTFTRFASSSRGNPSTFSSRPIQSSNSITVPKPNSSSTETQMSPKQSGTSPGHSRRTTSSRSLSSAPSNTPGISTTETSQTSDKPHPSPQSPRPTGSITASTPRSSSTPKTTRSVVSSGSITITPLYSSTDYPAFASLTGTITTTTTDDGGHSVPLVVGPSGRGWKCVKSCGGPPPRGGGGGSGGGSGPDAPDIPVPNPPNLPDPTPDDPNNPNNPGNPDGDPSNTPDPSESPSETASDSTSETASSESTSQSTSTSSPTSSPTSSSSTSTPSSTPTSSTTSTPSSRSTSTRSSTPTSTPRNATSSSTGSDMGACTLQIARLPSTSISDESISVDISTLPPGSTLQPIPTATPGSSGAPTRPSPGSTPLSSRPTSTKVVVSTVYPTSTSWVVVTPSPTPWVSDIPSVFWNSIPPSASSELVDGDPLLASESGYYGQITLEDGTLEWTPYTVPLINPAFDGGA